MYMYMYTYTYMYLYVYIYIYIHMRTHDYITAALTHIYAYKRSAGPPTQTQRHTTVYTYRGRRSAPPPICKYWRGPETRAEIYVYASCVGAPTGC